MATDFDTAVTESDSYSVTSFNDAADGIASLQAQGPPTQSSPPTSPEQAALQQYQKELARWQAQLAKALQQLGDSQALKDDHDGYHQVAALMATTATCAATVCQAIAGLVTNAIDDGNTNARLTALAGVLTALGTLAPSTTFQKPSSSGSSQ